MATVDLILLILLICEAGSQVRMGNDPCQHADTNFPTWIHHFMELADTIVTLTNALEIKLSTLKRKVYLLEKYNILPGKVMFQFKEIWNSFSSDVF